MKIFQNLIIILSLFFLASGSLYAQQKLTNVHGDHFNLKCQQCHTTENWKVNPNKIHFNHSSTDFALKGAHKVLQCRDCHKDLIFSHVGTQCVDCHKDIHEGSLGFNCNRCHNELSWVNRNQMYEAHQKTRFPLFGAHASLDCQSCHRGESPNEYATKNTDCKSCHLKDYLQTDNPSHKKAGFNLNCQQCHSLAANNWLQTSYVHSMRFPLSGGHSGLQCNDCHRDQFRNLSTECINCHQTDYDRTTNPNHRAFGFPTNCEQCHTINDWQRGPFDHLAASGFALKGAHANPSLVKCIDCHVNNQLTGLPRNCFGCHQKDFERVSDPNHVNGDFSHDCTVCHSEQAWSPATFDHSQTNFPLTGAHQSVDCASCHINGRFAGTPTDCYSCHRKDFEQVTDPNHVQNNFSHDCSTCHSTDAWSPSTFDHNQTKFPLTGAHQTVACISCHTNAYANTPMECVACHRQNYDNTTNPNHSSANFPTTCQDCHNTTAWSPANWDHDGQYFPIYSGKHKGEWNVCTDCHTNTADYSQFSCFAGCHEHNQSKTDDQHREVANYVYDSNACYSCHPTGNSEGSGGDD